MGNSGSFHASAAEMYFAGESIELLPCISFEAICKAIRGGYADKGVLAIQNTIAGSILTNYGLLQKYPELSISGEVWLAIDQQLMALPGQGIADINTVVSHPVALQQCGNFFNAHPLIAKKECSDTAAAARGIRENTTYGMAAIAGKKAADIYGLEIIRPDIADRKDNYTRFFILSRSPSISSAANKISLVLHASLSQKIQDLIRRNYVKDTPEITLFESLSDNYSAIEIECKNGELTALTEQLKTSAGEIQILGMYTGAALPVSVQEADFQSSPTTKI